VYLGDLSAASDRAMLRRHGVTHVICCVGDSGVSFRGDLQYAVIFVGECWTFVVPPAADKLYTGGPHTRSALPPLPALLCPDSTSLVRTNVASRCVQATLRLPTSSATSIL